MLPLTSDLSGRIFIAVPLTEHLRTSIAAHLARYVLPPGLQGRQVAIENWHLTIRFLGDTSATAAEAVDRFVFHDIEPALKSAEALSPEQKTDMQALIERKRVAFHLEMQDFILLAGGNEALLSLRHASAYEGAIGSARTRSATAQT